MHIEIHPARIEDCDTVADLIHGLAAYEKLSESCHATGEKIRASLFCDKPVAHCILAWEMKDAGDAAEIPTRRRLPLRFISSTTRPSKPARGSISRISSWFTTPAARASARR